MKKSYLIIVSIPILSSIIYSQEKSSFQFSGSMVYPLSSSPGLLKTNQYNYNISTRFNFFVSADYSVWDKRNFNYTDKSTLDWGYNRGYSETDPTLSRIIAGGRYLINPQDHFKLFVDTGLG